MSNEQNLEEINVAITKAIDIARAKADKALELGEITESEWQKAKDKWGKLETTQLEVKGILIEKELQEKLLNNNFDSPRSKIEQATNRLDKSAGKINDFNNFLSEVNNALKIVSSSIKIISPLV